MRRLYLVAGLLFVLLGSIGAVLPLLPTVPFLLLAVFCFARSSPELERKILDHPTWGPQIRDWQERRVIARKAKIAALVTLAIAVVFSWLTIGHPWAWISVGVMVVSGSWIATRNEDAPVTDAKVLIAPAREQDLCQASELCLRSKAHWGYDEAFIDACREELTLTPLDLANGQVALARVDAEMVGVAHLRIEDERAHLDKLFIDPSMIGRGIGNQMFDWVREQSALAGAQEIHVTSDPQAVGFYEKLGFNRIGQEPSGSIPGRVLPIMSLSVCR